MRRLSAVIDNWLPSHVADRTRAPYQLLTIHASLVRVVTGAMFKIHRVEIDGFWGNSRLETDLNESVNIFIGANGSGKTTFINFLEASLTADLNLLGSLQFREIRLLLKHRSKTRRIRITRIPETLAYDRLSFRIGRSSYSLPLFPKEMDHRRTRLHPRYLDAINEVQDCLSQLIGISWLSVHRELLDDEYRDPFTRRTVSEKNPIDRRLEDLATRFTQYQLQLQSESSKLSDSFRREVLLTMLYSEVFDTFSTKQEPTLDLLSIREGLSRTYDDLGVFDPEVPRRIDQHISMLGRSIEALEAFEKEQKPLAVDDVLPLSLLRRTQHIVELSTDIETKKKAVFRPVEDYLEILRRFAADKSFDLNPDLTGELLVHKGKTELSLEQLSSGEKQLFILLTEALLQRGRPFIFIADEPELSLHIGWQKRILSVIKALNPHSQIIVATHAPEVAGKWRNSIINMKDIIHEQRSG